MQPLQEKANQSPIHMNSTPQSKLLEIKRAFHVPVDQLFNAFTNAEALKNWWWPNVLYADHIDWDFRVGSKYFINMKGHDHGGGMTGLFEEIVSNKRIVMTDQFSDENGRAISAQEANMPGHWPKVGYITFDFASIDANTSSFILSQEGIPNEAQKDCIQGWAESFDKLGNHLNDRKH